MRVLVLLCLSVADSGHGCGQKQVPEAVTEAINTEVSNVRKLLDSETSAESIKEAVSTLQKALMKIGEHLAQSGQVTRVQTPVLASPWTLTILKPAISSAPFGLPQAITVMPLTLSLCVQSTEGGSSGSESGSGTSGDSTYDADVKDEKK